MSKTTVGWIGLGNMGIPMSRNLMKAGYSLAVYNRTEEKIKPLIHEGATSASSPARLWDTAEVVFIMVTDDAAVTEILTGENALLSNPAAKGKLIINTSTISPETSKAMAAQCSEAGIHYLEAPVSGTVKPAENGALLVIAGGPDDVLARAKPYLDCIGNKIMHVGDYGAASIAKLAINLLVGFNVQGLAEAVLFAQKNGVDTQDMLTIINEGACGNGVTKGKSPSILSGNFSPAFTVKNYAKDLRLAKAAGVTTPMANALHDTYQQAIGAHGDDDLMAVIQYLEKP